MPEIGNNIAQADINLVDETFDSSQSVSYHLSIQIEQDRLSFCVINTVINKYVVLRSYSLSNTGSGTLVSACRIVFEKDELLRLSYKSSSHLWISPRYTFVPEHLFIPGEVDVYLTFNHGYLYGEQTLYHHSRATNVCHVFSCPEGLMILLRMYHPHIHFFHHSKPFIESVVSATPQRTDIAIYFYSCWVDIAVAKNMKILFYNSFKINAPADTVYYLVGVSNMFDVQLSLTRLIYAGSLNQMPPEIEILKNYVGHMVECEPPNAFTYSHYITDSFRRNFINLINSYECES